MGYRKNSEFMLGNVSIAVWDFLKNELTLIRDRFEEKPLYFGLIDKNFIFGSELKVFNKITNKNNTVSKKFFKLIFKI